MEFRYQSGEQEYQVQVERAGRGYRVTVNGVMLEADDIAWRDGALHLRLNGVRRAIPLAAEGARRWVWLDGQAYVLEVPAPAGRGRRRGPAHDTLEAQTPGVVRQVLAAEGEPVAAGQTLLILEAMKMEIKVTAPHAGRVQKILARAGDTVQRGQTLVELDSLPE